MKKGLHTLVLIFAAIFTMSAQANLTGSWESVEATEVSKNQFEVENYSFDGDKWLQEKVIYKDASKTTALYKVRSSGTFKKSEEKATQMVFSTSKVFITLLTDDQDLISEIGLNYCPLTKDEEKDISANGCAHIKSASRLTGIAKEVSVKGGEVNIGKSKMKKTS